MADARLQSFPSKLSEADNKEKENKEKENDKNKDSLTQDLTPEDEALVQEIEAKLNESFKRILLLMEKYPARAPYAAVRVLQIHRGIETEMSFSPSSVNERGSQKDVSQVTPGAVQNFQ